MCKPKYLHCTLLTWSRVQTTRVTLMSYLLKKAFSHNQLATGCKSLRWGFTWHLTSPILLVKSAIVSCWSNSNDQIGFWWFITFTYFWHVWTPVQSSPVHFSPVISDTHGRAPQLPYILPLKIARNASSCKIQVEVGSTLLRVMSIKWHLYTNMQTEKNWLQSH